MQRSIARRTAVGDAGLDPLRLVQLRRDADADAAQIFRVGNLAPARHLDRRRVARVAPGDDAVEQRAVAHGLRRRPDLVERRRERDDAVARDGAVGRAQADDPAERGRLLDRAAGVGAERPRREPRRHGGRRAAARAAGHARRVPRIERRAERRVLGGRAHRELVGVRLAEQRQPGVLDARGDGRVVDGDVAARGSSSRRSSRRPSVPITSLSAIGMPSPPGVVEPPEVARALVVARRDSVERAAPRR